MIAELLPLMITFFLVFRIKTNTACSDNISLPQSLLKMKAGKTQTEDAGPGLIL